MINTAFKSSPDGGDIHVTRTGIQRGNFLHAAIFCALFGGNVEESTKQEYRRYETNKSYWGNTFLSRQFNSQTERAIAKNTTTPDGLSAIRKAVFTDLQKLIPNEIDKVTEVYVTQSANSPKRIEIAIYVEAKHVHEKFIFEV
jgi:hypothetical protein